MTEAEWLASTNAQPMLDYLAGRVSERKLRQFAVACCRRVWHLIPRPKAEYRHVLELSRRVGQEAAANEYRAKLYATAAASCAAFAAAAAEHVGRDAEAYIAHAIHAASALTGAGYADEVAMVWSVAADATAADEATKSATERAAQAELMRKVFGNPFRPKRGAEGDGSR